MKTVVSSFCDCTNALLVILLLNWCVGCSTIREHSVTRSVWQDRRDSSCCQPAPTPNLKLFAAENPPDVLVEYNAVSDRRKDVRRLAYFLHANRERQATGKPPRFVNPRRDAGLVPIAVMECAPPSAVSGVTNTIYAVRQGNAFTLYQPETQPEFCQLPEFSDGSVWQAAALMPVVFIADVVVVGSCVAAVGAFACVVGLCESNTSWSP